MSTVLNDLKIYKEIFFLMFKNHPGLYYFESMVEHILKSINFVTNYDKLIKNKFMYFLRF